MNICRALLSINTLIIEDTLILFQELNVMTIAGEFFEKAYVKLDSLSARISYLVGDLHTRF